MEKTLGGRLRSLRGSLSQTEFARKIGVKQTSYSGWELDRKVPSADVIVLISNALGVSADYILGTDHVRSASAVDASAQARIVELENEVMKLRAVNAALQEAFTNVGRGATIVSAVPGVAATGA